MSSFGQNWPLRLSNYGSFRICSGLCVSVVTNKDLFNSVTQKKTKFVFFNFILFKVLQIGVHMSRFEERGGEEAGTV